MQTAVITGISRGIGKALAQKFLQNDFFVIGTSTSGVTDYEHENLRVFQLDLSDAKSIADCTEKIKNLNKNIDILLNSAATWVEELDGKKIESDGLRKTLEVNLIGTIDLTQHLIPSINTEGHIINISSRAGSFEYMSPSYYPSTRHPSYKISKAALNMFTKILSINLKNRIIVSAIHPGWVKTGMGGSDADIEPTEAAEDIFNFAISKPQTGHFWFKGKQIPW